MIGLSMRLCGPWTSPGAVLTRSHQRFFHTSQQWWQEKQAEPERLIKAIPYSELTIGVPTEVFPGERRVAMTPQNAALLLKKGFKRVLIEHGAGFEAQFPIHEYEAAGATMANSRNVWTDSDIVLKVRPPRLTAGNPTTGGGQAPFKGSVNNFVDGFRPGSTIISMLNPSLERSKPVVDMMAKKGVSSFAMDMIPRISRAQAFDALSSMANIAGYKAVLEASNHFGRFMTGQTTAAGKIPPCKVLVIGAGVAGLSAIATVLPPIVDERLC
jgi:NAD(P) transhydrogenase